MLTCKKKVGHSLAYKTYSPKNIRLGDLSGLCRDEVGGGLENWITWASEWLMKLSYVLPGLTV